MKNIYVIISAIFTFLFFNLFQISTFSQAYDRSNFDYWINKMEDPDQNYHQLVQEFNNYWAHKDKANIKGTGYKQFKRWQYAMTGMAGPDGKLLPASYFSKELKEFKQFYGGKGIVGNWDFVGPEIIPIFPDSMNETGIGRLTCVAFHPSNSNILFNFQYVKNSFLILNFSPERQGGFDRPRIPWSLRPTVARNLPRVTRTSA